MKVSKKLTLALAAAATVAVTPGTASLAQEGGDSLALEEIIVNARKRDESLQSVPVAVDVFSQARLEQLGVFNVQDIARFSSGLQFDQGVLPTDTRPVIRGAISLRGRPNTGIMVDFVDVSSEALTVGGGGITTNLRLLDLERVEIVKGPQSALYGRSAFTGAINYVTRRPSENFTGEVNVAAEDFGTTDISLMLSGPLTDAFRASIMLNKYDTDGWYENPNTGGELGAVDSTGGSLAFEWDITDKVTSFFRAEYTETEATPRAEVLVAAMDPTFDPMLNFLGTGTVTDDAVQFPHAFTGEICNTIDRAQPYFDSFGAGPTCRPLNVGEQFATEADIDLSADPRTGADFLGSTVDTLRVHFDIDYQFDNANLKYILGYLDNDTFIQEDFDKNSRLAVSVPFAFSQYGLSAMAQQSLNTEQWNHELRLTGDTEKTSWMVSVLNWREDVDLAFDDEWWLREGADPAQVLALLNQTVFSFLQGGPVDPILGIQIPPPFCNIFYPTDPNCVNEVTSLATAPGDTPATPILRSTNHWSLAGMFVYNFNEKWSTTLEGRIIREEIDYQGRAADVSFYSQFGQDPYWGFLFGPGEWTSNNISETAFTPKVTVDYAASENVLFYGYYAHGFKPGGVATTDANGDVSDGRIQARETRCVRAWLQDLDARSLDSLERCVLLLRLHRPAGPVPVLQRVVDPAADGCRKRRRNGDQGLRDRPRLAFRVPRRLVREPRLHVHGRRVHELQPPRDPRAAGRNRVTVQPRQGWQCGGRLHGQGTAADSGALGYGLGSLRLRFRFVDVRFRGTVRELLVRALPRRGQPHDAAVRHAARLLRRNRQ